MADYTMFNINAEKLESALKLSSSPIAVKMLEKESDIPDGTLRPKKDRGFHLAQCQAFAMSRRENTKIAMLKEDNWCPGAVIAYGLVDLPKDSPSRKNNPGERFEYGRYIGILTAPLKNADFRPDVVIIYLDTNQLRNLLLALPQDERPSVSGHFFPFSCASSVCTPMIKNEYAISLPDPGEYARALTPAGEMMLSIPADKFCSLVKCFEEYRSSGPDYAHETSMMMRPDFPQPDLYKKVFGGWGMDHD